MSSDLHNPDDKENIDVNRKVHTKEKEKFEAKDHKNIINYIYGEGESLFAKNEQIPEFSINHERK
jgi:hypothetical protein